MNYQEEEQLLADIRRRNRAVTIKTDLQGAFAIIATIHVALREGGSMKHLPSYLIEQVRELEKEFSDIPLAKKYFDEIWDRTIDEM